MPYYITDRSPECEGWATVKEDGEVMGCHTSKDDAIAQGVAIAQSEGSTFEGELRQLPDNYRPALAEDVPEGRACGNCIFYDESRVSEDGTQAWCERWDEFVDGAYYCNAWEEKEEGERRQVNLTPPGYMRASARRGLAWHRDGLSGDGLVERTVREATAMAAGNMTADKWTRTAAWIARHLVDLDAPAAQPDHPNYPSPGVVAMALWGGGVNRRQANRALEYARGVVDRLAEENEGRAKGEAVTKLETRVNLSEFEVRDTGEGMTFTGYAAVFNSPSEPLPFTERIAPGAFRRSLRDRSDIKLLWNHDTGEVLASTRSGTLRMYEDEKGLRVEAELANTSRGRDAAELIRTQRVDSMSFGFTVPPGGDEWSEDGSERTVKSVRLFEVSIVSYPAFTATAGSTAVRALDKIATRAEVDVDALADALLKIENGEDITSDDRALVEKVLDELLPVSEEPATVEAEDEDLSAELLALKKAKLKLLGGL
jgi:HK97 family phage prohead protease